MYLNIITPVTRYGNLNAIRRSINIPKKNFRWICVFDGTTIPNNIPSECEAYVYVDENSRMGNGQRNFALNLVKEGHIYFNDDDTTIHPFLWRRVESLDDHDFIHFSQINKDGSLRLEGDKVVLNCIDSHNFIVGKDCVGDTRWVLDRYDADGLFAHECYQKSILPIFIPKVLSVYNSLK